MTMRVLSVLFVLVAIAIVGYLLADWYQGVPLDVESHFVGRESCVECHQTQAALFHGSDHDLAMDLATDESVLANFDDQQIEHYGITSRMFRDGSRFMVSTEGRTGEMEDFEVKYVFGVRPLQQYMVELDRPADAKPNEIGRVQVLRISWDTNSQKWFHLDPPDVREKLEPNDPLHWTGITQNWNASCADCHSTDLKKNFNALSNEYRTTFSEIDVSCEACHGPGSLHVDLANQKSPFWDRNHQFGLAKLKTESNLPQIETCAPCHSRRVTVDDKFQPGCNFDDYYATQLLANRIYHADGQIRDEDYVYGSFIQSKMYHNGIRCSDCHDPHSAKVKFNDNQLCTSCHQHPAGKYDTPNHHHHEPGTPGASCVECHMPATTYMELDARRDHSLRVPRPDLSVRFGTPNACTGCHIDESKLATNEKRRPLKQYLDWIMLAEEGDVGIKSELERVNQAMFVAAQEWYPEDQSPAKSEYYEQLTIGRSTDAARVPTLVDLSNDRKAPAIFRASALNALMDDASEESLNAALKAITDPDSKVVAAAIVRLDMESIRIGGRAQYGENTAADLELLKSLTQNIASLLSHSSKRVRIEAARTFVSLPPDARQNYAEPDRQKAFQLALDEYKKSLYIENDRAVYHMMLGGLHEMMNDPDRAIDAYRAAVTVEPNLAGPRSNLATLLESKIDGFRNQLRQSQSSGGMQAGQLQGMYSQMQTLAMQVAKLRFEENGLLAVDVERSAGLPDTHGLHYRFAMSSYVQGNLELTEKHLLEAHAQQPDNPMYLMGLSTYFIHVQQPKVALKYIEPLVKMDGQHPGYRALADQAKQMIEAGQTGSPDPAENGHPDSKANQPQKE